MLHRIARRLSWGVSTILLMMDPPHTVMEQVVGMYVPIELKWLLTIPCVQQHNFTQVGLLSNYN